MSWSIKEMQRRCREVRTRSVPAKERRVGSSYQPGPFLGNLVWFDGDPVRHTGWTGSSRVRVAPSGLQAAYSWMLRRSCVSAAATPGRVRVSLYSDQRPLPGEWRRCL